MGREEGNKKLGLQEREARKTTLNLGPVEEEQKRGWLKIKKGKKKEVRT